MKRRNGCWAWRAPTARPSYGCCRDRAAGVATPLSPDELAVLNPYAVTLRYDDEDLNLVTPEEAKRLVDELLIWAERQIAGM